MADYEDKCYVYWIRRKEHKNISKEGYVGVSIHPEKRFKEHRRKSSRCQLVNRKLVRHDDCDMFLIFEGNRDDCLKIEALLRPEPNIGWNLAEGGVNAPLKSNGKGVTTPFGGFWGIKEAARCIGIPESTIRKRLVSSNFPDWNYDGVTIKEDKSGVSARDMWIGGFVFTYETAMSKYGISKATVYRRISSKNFPDWRYVDD